MTIPDDPYPDIELPDGPVTAITPLQMALKSVAHMPCDTLEQKIERLVQFQHNLKVIAGR